MGREHPAGGPKHVDAGGHRPPHGDEKRAGGEAQGDSSAHPSRDEIQPDSDECKHEPEGERPGEQWIDQARPVVIGDTVCGLERVWNGQDSKETETRDDADSGPDPVAHTRKVGWRQNRTSDCPAL